MTEKPVVFKKDEKGRFVAGTSGNGRAKGSRNKLGEAFTDALYADFQENGIEAITKVRDNDPSTYVRVIAGLLPKEVKIEQQPLGDMSDDELGRLIDLIRAADGASVSVGAGESAQESGKSLN